jgi:hypothetical protein
VRVDAVNGSATPASPQGSAWNKSFKFLQDALTHTASLFGSSQATEVHIWLADGDYHPDRDASNQSGTGNRAANFTLLENVHLYGGFSGSETLITQRDPSTYVANLTGNIGSSGDDSDNSYHVLFAANGDLSPTNCRIDGVTIRDGYDVSDDEIHVYGAGWIE